MTTHYATRWAIPRLGPGLRRDGAVRVAWRSIKVFFPLPASLLSLLLLATQATAAPHSGIARPRTGPELSDIALFVMAAIGVFLVRRALRKRFTKRPPRD